MPRRRHRAGGRRRWPRSRRALRPTRWRGERGEEAVGDVEQSELAHQLHDGDDTEADEQAQHQPTEASTLVDRRLGEQPRRQADGDDGPQPEQQEHGLAGVTEERQRRHLQQSPGRQLIRDLRRVADDGERESNAHAHDRGDDAETAGPSRSEQRASGDHRQRHGDRVEPGAERGECTVDVWRADAQGGAEHGRQRHARGGDEHPAHARLAGPPHDERHGGQGGRHEPGEHPHQPACHAVGPVVGAGRCLHPRHQHRGGHHR